jgi:hypothetical protein
MLNEPDTGALEVIWKNVFVVYFNGICSPRIFLERQKENYNNFEECGLLGCNAM